MFLLSHICMCIANLKAKPFEWRRSIRLSSLRAWVRFSSWSWRWIFSSISAWIVSCSSKLRLCRTSMASGMNKSKGLNPLIVTSVHSLCHIFRQVPLRGGSQSCLRKMHFTAAVNFISLNQRGGDNCLFLSKAVDGELPVVCFKIHPSVSTSALSNWRYPVCLCVI